MKKAHCGSDSAPSRSFDLQNCRPRLCHRFHRAGKGIGTSFVHILFLIGKRAPLYFLYAVTLIVPIVQILQLVPGPLPASSFTIRTAVRPHTSCSRIGHHHSYVHGQKEKNHYFSMASSARTTTSASRTCLILKRSKNDGPPTYETKSPSKTSTSLNLSRLRNSHNDYVHGEGSDQMARRRKRRSRQRQQEIATNNELDTEAQAEARRRSRRKRQMYEYNYGGDASQSPSEKAPAAKTANSNDGKYNRNVRSVMRRRKNRQRRNDFPSYNSNNDNWDDDILSSTVDLSVQAMNGVKYVARKTASTSKHLLNDLGSEINKRLIDDDDYHYRNGVEIDNNGVQEVDWYYVSKDKNRDNSQTNKGGWVRKSKTKRNTSVSSPSSSPYSQSRQNYIYSRQDRTRRRERPKYKAEEVSKERIQKQKQQQQQQQQQPSSNQNDSLSNDCNATPLLLPPTLETDIYFPSLDNEGLDEDDTDNNENEKRKGNENGTGPSPASNSKSQNQQYRNREHERTQNSTRQRRRRRRSDSINENKKVYSVYPQSEGDSGEVVDDVQELYGKVAANAIDSVGNMMVDVVEGKYWNTTDNNSSNKGYKQVRSKLGNNDDDSSLKRGHWRDRLAQRVDYALGVHQDGNYYKSWQEKLNREKMSENGNDPVSIFYGRQKREDGPKRNVNFWEEDGSLMSLFFGRTPNGNKLSFNRASSANICTTAFKVSFQYSIAILSQVCRWASCRGSLPQPIVVFFLAASALSAPRRRRLVTIGITLIALRTLAEALHGYVHDGWEEDLHEKSSKDVDSSINDSSK